MKIRLVLLVEDEDAIDTEDSTGLTNEAYERLVDALPDLGFGIISGPDVVAD